MTKMRWSKEWTVGQLIEAIELLQYIVNLSVEINSSRSPLMFTDYNKWCEFVTNECGECSNFEVSFQEKLVSNVIKAGRELSDESLIPKQHKKLLPETVNNFCKIINNIVGNKFDGIVETRKEESFFLAKAFLETIVKHQVSLGSLKKDAQDFSNLRNDIQEFMSCAEEFKVLVEEK